MKWLNLLAPAAVILCLVSCQQEIEDQWETENPTGSEAPKRKMLLDETIYDASGNPHHSYYGLFIEDSAARTITYWTDTVLNVFDRRYFDADGRLLKIVYNNWDDTVPLSKDSVVFTRVGPGHITWKYAWNTHSYDAVTVSLPGGRTQITVTNTEDDPSVYYSRFLLNANGTLDSLKIVSDYTGTSYFTKEVFYNGGGTPVSIVTNSWQSITTFTQQITKDLTKGHKG